MKPIIVHSSFKDKFDYTHKFTLAILIEHRDPKVYSKVSYGISVCNPHDAYDSTIGEELALERASKTSSILMYMPKDILTKGMVNTIADTIKNRIIKEPSKYVPCYGYIIKESVEKRKAYNAFMRLDDTQKEIIKKALHLGIFNISELSKIVKYKDYVIDEKK